MSSSPSPYARIQAYYEAHSPATQFISGDNQEPPPTHLEQDVAGLSVDEKPAEITEEQKIQAFRREFLDTGGITDQVAKESKHSNASSAELHDVDTGASSGGNAHAQAHKANPGPVKADNLPAPESKEELKKRAEELNK